MNAVKRKSQVSCPNYGRIFLGFSSVLWSPGFPDSNLYHGRYKECLEGHESNKNIVDARWIGIEK